VNCQSEFETGVMLGTTVSLPPVVVVAGPCVQITEKLLNSRQSSCYGSASGVARNFQWGMGVWRQSVGRFLQFFAKNNAFYAYFGQNNDFKAKLIN